MKTKLHLKSLLKTYFTPNLTKMPLCRTKNFGTLFAYIII